MGSDYTILLADDEPDIRRAVRRALSAPGYTIHEVSDGAEALAFLKANRVDVVVSDYNMPRMNGLEMLTQVRMMHPDVVRILLTARADVQLAVRALNEGSVHRFLLKPWDHIDLKGTVQMALHSLRKPTAAAAAK